MEEKEFIKVPFGMVCIVVCVLIVIIVGLLGYIYYLKKDIKNISQGRNVGECNIQNDINEMSVSKEENVENTNEEESPFNQWFSEEQEKEINLLVKENNPKYLQNAESKGFNIPQLEGMFYHIGDLLIESRKIEKVNNYKNFEYDLDGDGKIETVTLKHITDEDGDSYTVICGEKTVYYSWESILGGEVGIIDLDENDSYLEIFVYDNGPSDDPRYSFYRKVGNDFIQLGIFDIENGFILDGKGRVLSGGRMSMPTVPQMFDSYYTINNNQFIRNEIKTLYNKDAVFYSNYRFFTEDFNNLEKACEDYRDNEMELSEVLKLNSFELLDYNVGFTVLDFIYENDNHEECSVDLKVKLSDGREGYLIHPYGRFYFYD